MDPLKEMSVLKDITTKIFTRKEFLTYYRNIWFKNLIARTIDVQNDLVGKAKNPDEEVLSDDQQRKISVKQRLEERKILVQDALDVIGAIDELIKIDSDVSVSFEDKFWSVDALKVADDMIKKEEVKPVEEPKKEEGQAEKPVEEKKEEPTQEAKV